MAKFSNLKEAAAYLRTVPEAGSAIDAVLNEIMNEAVEAISTTNPEDIARLQTLSHTIVNVKKMREVFASSLSNKPNKKL